MNWIWLLGFLPAIRTLNVQESWSANNRNDDIQKVVALFGFEKTDVHGANGYVFGNITSKSQFNLHTYTMVLIKRDLFIPELSDILRETDARSDNKTCSRIFSLIHDNHGNCSSESSGESDFFRFVPCKKGSYCNGSTDHKNIVHDYQFTFVVNQTKPTFYYLIIFACIPYTEKNNCEIQWKNNFHDKSILNFNINLVNGNPATSSRNFFTYQFSYEQQDIILYLLMMVSYTILCILQTYAFIKQRNRNFLLYIFTLSLYLHWIKFLLDTLHKLIFASDGMGIATLTVIAAIIEMISLSMFILFVLVIAKGWPITRDVVTAKPLLIFTWLSYLTIEIMLYTWRIRSTDILTEADEYHTFPGWFGLGIRVVIMMWFLFELRATMMLEQDQQRLRFYLHFGAGIMVWFVHLPIVAVIGLQISLMWRFKLILGFSFSANFFAYSVVTNFMWPTKTSYHFLTHPIDADYSEELEYFEEAPSESLGRLTNSNYNHLNVHNPFAFENSLHDHVKA